MTDENQTVTPETTEEENLKAEAEALEREAQQSEAVEGEHIPGQEEQEQAIETGQLLVMVIKPTTQLLCPNWNISDDEINGLAQAYGQVIDKYFPDYGQYLGPEIAALVLTAMVVAPRVNTPRHEEAKKPEGQANESA